MSTTNTDAGFLRLKSALFPSPTEQGEVWRHLYTWLAVALALRSIIALGGDFVIHPDEIMHYLEPAHRAVFGSGIVLLEFQYGGRSWLVPGFVATILWALDAVGLGVPWVYVYAVKLVFCALSLFVPWGCYHFARHMLGEQSARMALVATCLWPYLVVFAHKPFTEFVATSLLFATLGLACRPWASGRLGAFAFGGLLALVSAVRMQYLPLAGILWLARAMASRVPWVMASVAGGILVLVLVGILEHFTWGFPFHSYYLNILINQEFDRYRDPQELHFYFSRLAFVTAGGALVMLYSFVRHTKRHLLIAIIAALTLALHMTQVHKELRFVFVLLPLTLVVLGDQLSMWSKSFPRMFSLRAFVVASTLFLLLIVSSAIDDEWLHDDAVSGKKGDINYLFRQNNIFDVYLELAKKNDVQGLFHRGDPYFNTPGYYYLHHDIPFYDLHTFSATMNSGAVEDPSELVTHIVFRLEAANPVPSSDLEINAHKYQYVASETTSPVKRWVSHTPVLVSEEIAKIAIDTWGISDPEPPKAFEFTDGSSIGEGAYFYFDGRKPLVFADGSDKK